MIPLSETDLFQYVVDGVTFFFKPVIGSNEYKVKEMFLSLGDENLIDDKKLLKNMEITDNIFNMFVADWKCSSRKILDFPKDVKASEMFNFEFKSNLVFNVILKQNELSIDEKKS